MTNAMPPAAMPNKAFFEKVGMFKAKSKELTFPVDQKRGAGHGAVGALVGELAIGGSACSKMEQISRAEMVSRDLESGVGMAEPSRQDVN